jgi:hypothetical protein
MNGNKLAIGEILRKPVEAVKGWILAQKLSPKSLPEPVNTPAGTKPILSPLTPQPKCSKALPSKGK